MLKSLFISNVLPLQKQTAVIPALAKGNSIRSIERMTGIDGDTIMRLGVRLGEGCAKVLDEKMRGPSCKRVEGRRALGIHRHEEQKPRILQPRENAFFCPLHARNGGWSGEQRVERV